MRCITSDSKNDSATVTATSNQQPQFRPPLWQCVTSPLGSPPLPPPPSPADCFLRRACLEIVRCAAPTLHHCRWIRILRPPQDLLWVMKVYRSRDSDMPSFKHYRACPCPHPCLCSCHSSCTRRFCKCQRLSLLHVRASITTVSSLADYLRLLLDPWVLGSLESSVGSVRDAQSTAMQAVINVCRYAKRGVATLVGMRNKTGSIQLASCHLDDSCRVWQEYKSRCRRLRCPVAPVSQALFSVSIFTSFRVAHTLVSGSRPLAGQPRSSHDSRKKPRSFRH